ncbi:MAG TPA: hypothetical protein PK816_15120, partial [Candidatus Cloacimonadota bacterium]|nr:hypothetical protein [Candidatus Cloacimonadota bacterium]
VTIGSEVRRRKNMEHSESELMLVYRVGNSSEYEKAQKSDNSVDYDRWLHIQAGRLNQRSPLMSDNQ